LQDLTSDGGFEDNSLIGKCLGGMPVSLRGVGVGIHHSIVLLTFKLIEGVLSYILNGHGREMRRERIKGGLIRANGAIPHGCLHENTKMYANMHNFLLFQKHDGGRSW
jgi:hypothetical protein